MEKAEIVAILWDAYNSAEAKRDAEIAEVNKRWNNEMRQAKQALVAYGEWNADHLGKGPSLASEKPRQKRPAAEKSPKVLAKEHRLRIIRGVIEEHPDATPDLVWEIALQRDYKVQGGIGSLPTVVRDMKDCLALPVE